MAPQQNVANEEKQRLEEDRVGRQPWRKWGPYLSERQWGTVREDYSPHGDAWTCERRRSMRTGTSPEPSTSRWTTCGPACLANEVEKGLRRPHSAERGGCAGLSAPAGPDTHSFPGPWPFEVASGSLCKESVQLGRAHGWGGSPGDSSLFSGAAFRWGSGGFWEGASAPSPFSGDSFALSPFIPRPTSGAWYRHRGSKVSGHGRRPIKAAGCRGCGRGHPIGLAVH